MPSDLPVKTRHQPAQQLPLSADSLRTELLDAAGFDKSKRIAVLRKVLESAEKDLDATKQTPIVDHGQITDIHVQPDHTARAKAREQLIDLIGVTGKAASGSSTGPGKVEIPLAPWMAGLQVTVGQAPTPQPVAHRPVEVIDVTPQDVEVENESA